MSDTEAKTAPASPRKLRKQREQGSVASGQELSGLFGAAAGMILLGGLAVSVLGGIFDFYTIALDSISVDFQSALEIATQSYGETLLLILAPIVGISIGASVVIGIIYNGGILFAMKPVTPQMERISPMTGLKRIYGKRGWVETGVSIVRLAIWLSFAAFCSWIILPQLFMATGCTLGCSAHVVTPLAWLYLIGAVVLFLLAAGIDAVVQRALFLSEQRMTASEVKRERKEQSGTPEVRKERRRRAKEGSTTADSIGPGRANMCFFSAEGAVTIRYHPQKAPLPRVTAKSKTPEGIAALREHIRERGLPELEHPGITASCLKKAPGEPIDADMFTDFAYALREMFSR